MSKKKNRTEGKPSSFTRHWDKILFLFILGLIILASPGQNIYTTAFDDLKPVSDKPTLPQFTPHPYPINFTNIFPGSSITATGIVILDADSGVYLYRRNENMQLAPASTTKLLTALVTLDHYSLDDVMTVKTMMTDGQTMGLVQGEKMTVENLLYGALIHSGNDAAYTLADNYPGGVGEFVKAMNVKAKALGLKDSHFTNPIGFDDPDHKMTTMDLARLAMAAMNNITIAKMVAIPAITISDVTHTYYHSLKNVNELLGKVPGVEGIKTGYTEEAGQNLITLVDRNGHRVILVVLQSQDRFGESAKLIEWVYGNYHWENYPAG
jgi:serine-type D-Ala-D-Ala carboxypeptidase (penicillin-binding protein 5/6)